MPTRPPYPIQPLPKSRFEAFMERNIVIVAICAGLAIVAVIGAVASLFH